MDTPVLSLADHQLETGRRLRRLIDLLGLNYVDAAELMGISKSRLNHWMVGRYPLQLYALYRLCRTKGVDFNYVCLGDWWRLPHHLAQALEDDMQSKLAGHAAAALPEDEKVGKPKTSRKKTLSAPSKWGCSLDLERLMLPTAAAHLHPTR